MYFFGNLIEDQSGLEIDNNQLQKVFDIAFEKSDLLKNTSVKTIIATLKKVGDL